VFDVIADVGSLANSQLSLVYPNPVNDQFTIHYSLPIAIGITIGAAVDISIYNTLGQKIYMAADCRLLTVDCRLFSNGIYWLEVRSGDKTQRAKFVKE